MKNEVASLIKLIKKNILFIIIFLVIIFCLIMRNSYLPVSIVSHPDSQITFSTGESVLEQTWQPQVKKIAGIRVPYTGTANFSSDMELTIYSDDLSKLLLQTRLHQDFRENTEGVLEFNFKALKVMPGERYRIQLRYEAPSAEGALLIAAGSNYSGCSIDDKACNEAAAFEITFIKNSRVFWLFAVFFPFTAFSLLFMTIWNRKWEECIGLSVIVTTFILYVSGLFEKLMTGVSFIYILAVISLFASIYFYNKKDMRVKDLYSPALLIYAGLFVFIVLNCHNAWFARVDEYAQWGMSVKDMFYYQSFAKHANTTVALPRYLPFSALIEYFFIYANGLYSQELVYIAFQTVLLSILVILCAMAGKKWRYLIPSVAVMIGVPAIFFSDVYNCIYVDPLLAVLAAYVLICYYSEEMTGFNLLRIIGGLFALTTTKDMGMVIAGLLTVVMMADRLYRSIRQKKPVIKRLICPCLCAVFVIAVFASWQIYMSIPAKITVSEAPKTESTQISESVEGGNASANVASEKEVHFQSTINASGISLDEILKLFRHEDGGYRYQSIKNFLIAIFDDEAYWLGNIGVSYVDMYILMIMLIGALGLAKFWGSQTERMLTFGIFALLAGMCYGIVLEFMYLFAFPMGEALLLVSYTRYLASFLGGVGIAFSGLLMQQATNRETANQSHNLAVVYGLMAGIIICTPMREFIIKNMDDEITEDRVYGYDDMAEVLRSFSAEAEKIYYVYNGGNSDDAWIFKHAVCPLLNPYTQSLNIYASEEAYLKQVDIWTKNGEEIQDIGQIASCETWEKRLKNCQYVFLFHPNDVFKESYESLFADPDTIGDGTFYQVQQSGEKVTLEYIGKVGVKVSQ